MGLFTYYVSLKRGGTVPQNRDPGGHVHFHRRLLTALDSALCTLCASFRVTCHYHQHNLMIIILFIISTEIESLVESLFQEIKMVVLGVKKGFLSTL